LYAVNARCSAQIASGFAALSSGALSKGVPRSRAGQGRSKILTLLLSPALSALRGGCAGESSRIPAEIVTGIAEHAADDALTAREIEVLRRVAAGKSNRLIAAKLAISESMIKAHMKSILPKLDGTDRTHAVMIAPKRGILDA
jgi:DNA-binding NarL/FixJ family response regulator